MAATISNPLSRYPPSNEELRRFYVGKDIGDVPKPAVVLDVAIIKRHCQAMLQTMKQLGVGFRAHVKTHKTPQIARFQVGTESSEANFVVSTVAELETLLPLLQELQGQNRLVNVLYGIPLVPSQVPRLAALAYQLRTTDLDLPISVMIDHPDQLAYLSQFRDIAGLPAGVFLKVDTGYHRAGVPPDMLNKNGILEKLLQEERVGHARLIGIYSHSSLSYAATSPEEAISYLKTEIEGCRRALHQHSSLLPDRQLVISVGATPQVVSARSLLHDESSLTADAKALKKLLRDPGAQTGDKIKTRIELHAGVYTLLDMQQLETNAQRAGGVEEEIAISVIAEVCSVYNEGEREKPEALVAAGTLALGREPCKSYPGWAVVGNWRRESEPGGSRLIVERISQEHGVVAWAGGDGPAIPVRVGQAVRLYPNHACVTGALYGWYLVVDSSEDGEGSRIVDVWRRTTGW
ncbi:hypothetical protein CDV55_107676 [Aspergillus turcosus]|nr:hypothetical protein CDV55_107676 [Aspergillus turcosus]